MIFGNYLVLPQHNQPPPGPPHLDPTTPTRLSSSVNSVDSYCAMTMWETSVENKKLCNNMQFENYGKEKLINTQQSTSAGTTTPESYDADMHVG